MVCQLIAYQPKHIRRILVAENLEHAAEEHQEEPAIISHRHYAIPMGRYAMARPRMQAGTVSISRKQHIRWIFNSIADGQSTVPRLDISCPSLALSE